MSSEIFKIVKKLLDKYNSLGRWGNVILLAVLITIAFFNRCYMAVTYKEPGYIVEIFLIGLAAFTVYKIFKKNLFEINRKSIFRTLLIAGIALRLVFAIHDFIDRPVQDSDYLKHEKLGARIAFEGQFYDFAGIELRSFRQPGLPVLFALGLWIYNDPVTYSVIMIVFSFAVLISGFYLFRKFQNIASLISFGYLAISPSMLTMASSSNTQLSFFFFLILLFIVLKNYTGKFYQLVIIGALIAAEMYIRFNFLMLFILVPFILEMHTQNNYRIAIRNISFIFIFTLIFYSPWIYRNYNVFGTIRLMSTEGSRFYSSNVIHDYTKAGGYNGIPDSVFNKYKNLSEMEFDKALRNDAINFVRENPDIYLKGIPFRIMKYSGRQDWSVGFFFQDAKYQYAGILEEILQSVENYLFWIILFFPFIYLIRNKIRSPLQIYILWAYLIYSVILLPISETRSRYHFPYILFPVFAVALSERKGKEN